MQNTQTISFSLTNDKAITIKRFVYGKGINRSWYLDFLTDYAMERLTIEELNAAIEGDPRSLVVPGGPKLKRKGK